MLTVFGPRVNYRYAGDDEDWRWSLTHEGGNNSIVEHVTTEEGPVLISADYGNGRVFVSAESFFAAPHQRALQAVLVDALEKAVGWPTAAGHRHRFEMVTREDAEGRRYLFVINPDLARYGDGLRHGGRRIRSHIGPGHRVTL